MNTKSVAFLAGYLSKEAFANFDEYTSSIMEGQDAEGKPTTTTYYDVPQEQAKRNWDFASQLRGSGTEFSPEDSASIESIYGTPYGESIPEASMDDHKKKITRLFELMREREAGISKEANAYGNQGLNVQNFAPVNERRELDEEEARAVEKAKGKLIPKIFTNKADPIHADMSSPLAKSLLSGAGGGLMGATAGGILGGKKGALYGGGAGAGLLGILSYFQKRNDNEDLVEAMRRLPKGAVRRDMESDPVYQAEQDRVARLRAARLANVAR